MKKTTLFLMLTALCLLLCSCSSLGYVYTDAEEYTCGGDRITGQVEDLEINWMDGTVTVAYHSGDTIILSETAGHDLSSDTQLHWRLKGKELTVQYAASGFRSLPSLNKQLTVLLPDTLRLDDVKINVASAEVQADGIDADEIVINAASGRVALRQAGHAEKVTVSTASGGVAVAVEDADKLAINTASGQVIVDANQVDEVKTASVSGAVVLQFAHMPDEIKADAVSGNVTLWLPVDGGFTAEVETLSGVVRSSLPMKQYGDETYVYGNGRCHIQVDTVSGNVQIEENDTGERTV